MTVRIPTCAHSNRTFAAASDGSDLSFDAGLLDEATRTPILQIHEHNMAYWKNVNQEAVLYAARFNRRLAVEVCRNHVNEMVDAARCVHKRVQPSITFHQCSDYVHTDTLLGIA